MIMVVPSGGKEKKRQSSVRFSFTTIHLQINPAINEREFEDDLERKQNKSNQSTLRYCLFILIFHNAQMRPGTVEAQCLHRTVQPLPYHTHD